MKINGRDVNGRKVSSNMIRSSNSSINSLKNTSSHGVKNGNSVFRTFDNVVNSNNISNNNNITQMNNLNRNIIRDSSRSKGQQNVKFEQTFSKIILILVFGPMILNLVISIISALFFGIAN